MIEEVKAQIKRIEEQIAAEQKVYDSWKKFTDSDMKAAVINQQIGVVRGLEVARESLNYILRSQDNGQIAWPFPDPANLVEMGKAIKADIARGKK